MTQTYMPMSAALIHAVNSN